MDTNLSNDILGADTSEGNQLPQSLNILTILTFIGCAVGLLGSLFTKRLMQFSIKMIDKQMAAAGELSPNQVAKVVSQKEAMEATIANSTALTIAGIVGIGLCIFGAVMMRKLKKDGFGLYCAGQVIPLITGVVLLGTKQFSGGVSSYIGFAIPLIFIGLYAAQRKHLRF
jgi:hypothetical protein